MKQTQKQIIARLWALIRSMRDKKVINIPTYVCKTKPRPTQEAVCLNEK